MHMVVVGKHLGALIGVNGIVAGVEFRCLCRPWDE